MEIRLFTLGQLGIYVDGSELVALTTQPVRAALLIYLALERHSTREAVMACLWPEREARRARHALSQTLYALRRSLGATWIEVHGEALELYGGPFLDGWHLIIRLFRGRVSDCVARMGASRASTAPGQ